MDPQFGYSSDLDDKPLLARKVVYDVIMEELRKTPGEPLLVLDHVYVINFSYILGAWKAYVSTTLPDSKIYEVTYNRRDNEIYVDTYLKSDNRCIPLT